MSDSATDQLKAQLDEAKLRVSDLTRSLDESMRAEQDDRVTAELQRAQERVAALERALERVKGR